MLFDLRGSGRRRAVKIVYVTLALLMGGGLVLFGIGGGGALSGGLLDAITESNNSGGGGSERFAKAEADATAKARANPDDAALWAAVARARFNLAAADGNYDSNTNQYTAAGKQELQDAARAWEEHLKLAKNKADERVASLMVQAYLTLNNVEGATNAQEVVAQSRDSSGAYATLAQLAYAAGQTRKGDLARDKALKLTDPDMRETLRGQLEDARTQALGNADGAATPTPTPTSSEK